MQHSALGSTDLRVSRLALGTWGLSGEGYGSVVEAEQDRTFERALQLGIDVFEVADCYLGGQLLPRLGKALDGHPATVVVRVGTDLAARPAVRRFDRAFLEESVDKVCTRLGRVPDVVLLHNPSLGALRTAEPVEALAELVKAGKARAYGVSAGSGETAARALELGAQVLSLAFNILHQADLRAVAAQLETKKAGLLVHSVLAYGLLSGMWGAEREFPWGDHRAERWTREELRVRVRQLAAVRPLVSGEVPSLRGAAVRFALEQPQVSTVVLGPRSRMQLDQLVREAGPGPTWLAPAQLTALRGRLQEVGVSA